MHAAAASVETALILSTVHAFNHFCEYAVAFNPAGFSPEKFRKSLSATLMKNCAVAE